MLITPICSTAIFRAPVGSAAIGMSGVAPAAVFSNAKISTASALVASAFVKTALLKTALLKTSLLSFLMLASTATSALASSELTGSIRIGATYENTASNDGELFIRNFGSRLKWRGEKELTGNKKAIAYVELGLDPDDNAPNNSGIDQTRQLWAGVSGDFGTVKIGAQYAAFYELISSHADIAWWGSCWTEFECGRETQVLKFSRSSGPLSYAASIQAPDDQDDDVADQLEGGVNYDFGKYIVGVAASLVADEGADDGGLLIGAMIKGDVGPAKVVVTLRSADEDYANTNDTSTSITLGANLGNAYLVVNQGDVDDASPRYATLGYTLGLGPSALMYFEYQTIDADDGSDTDTIARATYKFDF